MDQFNISTLIQQLIAGLTNGMIIALIALGYTMVYGIIELINFAHGDLFMLGGFLTLTLVGLFNLTPDSNTTTVALGLSAIFVIVSVFCAGLNWSIDRLAYKPLRKAPKLAPLVSAIGVSFILMNLGLFWGGLPMDVFGGGNQASAPKNFPTLVSNKNLLESSTKEKTIENDKPQSNIQFSKKDLLVIVITVPLMICLTLFVKFTNTGKAMRAVAQNPVAAQLMGIDVNRIIGITFIIGGALAGAASIIYALYNNSIHFQMGYRTGMDAFTAAVIGGIGNLPGAMIGGLFLGVVRAMSDQYIAAIWTNVVVFGMLILILIFRPSGLLGSHTKEKV